MSEQTPGAPEATDPAASAELDPPIPTPVSQPDGTFVSHTIDQFGEERTILYDTEPVHRDGLAPLEAPLSPSAELDHLVHVMGEEASAPEPTVVMSEDGIWHSTRVDEYGNVREVSTDIEYINTHPVEEPREHIVDYEPVMWEHPEDRAEAYEAMHDHQSDQVGHDSTHDATSVDTHPDSHASGDTGE